MTFSVECRPLSCSKLQVHVSGPGGTCQVELGRLLGVVSLCVRLWPFHGRLSLWLPLFVALVFEFSGVLFYTRLHPLLGRHPGQLPPLPCACRRTFMSGTVLNILIESVKAVALSLRTLADTLDTAANRAAAARGLEPPATQVAHGVEPHPEDRIPDSVDWDLVSCRKRFTSKAIIGPWPVFQSGLRVGCLSVTFALICAVIWLALQTKFALELTGLGLLGIGLALHWLESCRDLGLLQRLQQSPRSTSSSRRPLLLTRFGCLLLLSTSAWCLRVRGIILGGGSPCQGNSSLNRGRKGLADPRSQQPEHLQRIRDEILALSEARTCEFITFLENVASMPSTVCDEYSTWLGARPVLIDAACYG